MARTLAIGDIHGCWTALEALIQAVAPQPDDTLITLGDYVDRGPDTAAVLDWLLHWGQHRRLIPLRGNHELMMLAARDNRDAEAAWLETGGRATLESYQSDSTRRPALRDVPTAHWRLLEEGLLPFHETETHLFVHANVYPDLPLTEQPDYVLYWEGLDDPPRHASGKVMICGHSSQKSGLPYDNGNAVCIDTYAWGGGWLSCLDVDSRRIWQANEQRETRQFSLDAPG